MATTRTYVAPDARTTLTKSLHTVKVVSRLAYHLLTECVAATSVLMDARS